MRIRDAFLAGLLILLATMVTAETPTPSSITDVVYDRTNRGRLLRKVDSDEVNAIDTEERGILSSIKNWGKTQYWLAAGKPDDEVKKALKMEELTGAALKSHPNYKKLEKFWYKREGRWMNKWVNDYEIPTRQVWDDLGLARMSADQRKNSDELRMYVRYATKHDNAVWKHKNGVGGIEPPTRFRGSPEEMTVKMQIWAKAKRNDWYVMESLGLDGLSKADRQADMLYKYFVGFVNLKKHPPEMLNAAG